MASDADATIAESVPEKKDRDPVASIAGQIPHLPTGPRAALRRMYLTQSDEAIGVVMGLLHRAGVPQAAWIEQAAFGRWQLLVYVAAVLSGTSAQAPHAPGRRLGRALWEAGYSENRLLRLTAAKGPALDDQVRRATQFLAKAGAAPVDLRTIHYLLSADTARAETARFDIARDYYDAQHARKGDTQ